MKKFNVAATASVVLISSVIMSPNVHAEDYAQTLCELVASDNKKRMKSFLSNNKLKIRNIFKGIQCEGKDILLFADSKNAANTGKHIIKRLPKKMLSPLLPALNQSGVLIAVAKERVGG